MAGISIPRPPAPPEGTERIRWVLSGAPLGLLSGALHAREEPYS